MGQQLPLEGASDDNFLLERSTAHHRANQCHPSVHDASKIELCLGAGHQADQGHAPAASRGGEGLPQVTPSDQLQGDIGSVASGEGADLSSKSRRTFGERIGCASPNSVWQRLSFSAEREVPITVAHISAPLWIAAVPTQLATAWINRFS